MDDHDKSIQRKRFKFDDTFKFCYTGPKESKFRNVVFISFLSTQAVTIHFQNSYTITRNKNIFDDIKSSHNLDQEDDSEEEREKQKLENIHKKLARFKNRNYKEPEHDKDFIKKNFDQAYFYNRSKSVEKNVDIMTGLVPLTK